MERSIFLEDDSAPFRIPSSLSGNLLLLYEPSRPPPPRNYFLFDQPPTNSNEPGTTPYREQTVIRPAFRPLSKAFVLTPNSDVGRIEKPNHLHHRKHQQRNRNPRHPVA
jgi:hypothetical protein